MWRTEVDVVMRISLESDRVVFLIGCVDATKDRFLHGLPLPHLLAVCQMFNFNNGLEKRTEGWLVEVTPLMFGNMGLGSRWCIKQGGLSNLV